MHVIWQELHWPTLVYINLEFACFLFDVLQYLAWKLGLQLRAEDVCITFAQTSFQVM